MSLNELNKNPFFVPENYFDRLPTQVQDRCATNQTKVNPGIWAAIKPRLAYVAGFGALALLAYGGFSFIVNNNTKLNTIANNKTEQIKKLPISANSFINSNAKSYADFINNSPIHIVNDKETKSKMDIDEDIMNYLAAENISIEDILGLE